MAEVAAAMALVALTATVASLIYLHLAPTGLSPLQHPVSQYGITPFRAGYRAATLSFAAAGAMLLWAVAAVGTPGPAEHLELLALAVFVLVRAAISWFPMDRPGAPRTASGRRHGLLAAAAFIAIAYAADTLGHGVAPAAFGRVAGASDPLGLLMGLCLLSMLVLGRIGGERPYFGAVERVFYLLALGWSVMVAIVLL